MMFSFPWPWWGHLANATGAYYPMTSGGEFYMRSFSYGGRIAYHPIRQGD